MDNKRELINSYIDGWKEKDKNRILSVLTEDCIIIESHGPTYNGKEIISKWIKNWISSSQINQWKITSFYEVKDIVFFEWIFECTVNEEKHHIEGLSMVKFKDNKIYFIREYRTTKPRFNWSP